MNNQLPSNDHIAAIIPCYTAIGDTTTIINTNGTTQIINTRIRTVLNRLARSRATDLIALKQKATYATNHMILQPLPLAPGLVLCPIKLRIPKVPGDTSTGYINLHAMTNIISSPQAPRQSIIKLAGGTELLAFWKVNTVKKHFSDARLAVTQTARSSEMPPELTFISQKLTEFFYELFAAYSLHHPSVNSRPTILTK